MRSNHQLHFNDVSLTKQSYQAECDVNNILAKYVDTGLITHIKKSEGTYGDFTGISDYQSSLNAVISAQNSFYELPAGIRKKFNNNPAELIHFIENESNYQQAYDLGLINEVKYTEWKSKQNTSNQGQSSPEVPLIKTI